MSQNSVSSHHNSVSSGYSSAASSNALPGVLVLPPQRDNSLAPPSWLHLPSSSYQYTHWHDILDHEVFGPQLRSPRIRDFPQQDGATQFEGTHLPGVLPSYQVTKDYTNQKENWENAKAVNLSYQTLGDPYQLKNFERVLTRLLRCKQLQLIDNSLVDLSNVTLPNCTELHLNRNCIKSFKKLPKCPLLERLNLTENCLSKLSGLSLLKRCPLKSLVLTSNPVEYISNFRHKVFVELPQLELLDGYPKLPSDQESNSSGTSNSPEQDTNHPSNYCNVS